MNNTLEFTSNITTTAVFSKDKRKRYILRMTWDENKGKHPFLSFYLRYFLSGISQKDP